MAAEEFLDLWVDKYIPSCLNDMVLNANTKAVFQNAIKTGNLTSCTFIGVQGTGKTSLAVMLSKEFDADTLFIPCATEGGIETLRTKIKQFVMAYSDKVKLVILDELDSSSATQDSSFQKGLRNMIEMSKDTRYICTANYNKVIPAVLSRCPIMDIRFEPKDILNRVITILKSEKIKYTDDNLTSILNIINAKFPDIRSVITSVQRQVVDGALVFNDDLQIVGSSSMSVIKQIIADMSAKKSLTEVRRGYLHALGKSGDYLNIATDLYVYVLENDIVKNSEYLQRLAHSVYELNMCVDKEIAFFGMICIIQLVVNK